MPTYDWQTWLAQWNQTLLHDADAETLIDAYPPEDGITPDVIASGWLGYPAATDAEIDHLEARIGARLPPSYRQFLQVSNGFRQPDVLVHRLLHAHEVDWLRVRSPSILKLWLRSQYLQSGQAQPDDFQLVLPSAPMENGKPSTIPSGFPASNAFRHSGTLCSANTRCLS